MALGLYICSKFELDHYLSTPHRPRLSKGVYIEKRPRSVYNASPIKETVPRELYGFLMKLDSPKEIVKALRLYLDTGDELLKHLSYADSYDTLYACVIGKTVK